MEITKRTVGDLVSERIEFYRKGTGRPSVMIVAGLHGAEATGIYAAERLVDELRRAEVKGHVTVVPRANPSAFLRLQRTSPFDEYDLNRIFPGKSGGTSSEQAAAHIWEIAREMDYIVDLHCCGPYGSPYILAQHAEYPEALELARQIDLPIVVQSSGAEGQLFVEAMREGIPSVILELPGGGANGLVDLAAGHQAAGALIGLLAHLDILPGGQEEDRPTPSPVLCGKLERIHASGSGLFLPQVHPGASFSKDEVLGLLDDERVQAGYEGFAVLVRPPSYAFRDSPLVMAAPRL